MTVPVAVLPHPPPPPSLLLFHSFVVVVGVKYTSSQTIWQAYSDYISSKNSRRGESISEREIGSERERESKLRVRLQNMHTYLSDTFGVNLIKKFPIARKNEIHTPCICWHSTLLLFTLLHCSTSYDEGYTLLQVIKKEGLN